MVDVKSVNSGGVAGIYEALRAGILLKAVKQLRVSEEAGVVEEVLKRLGKSESNVAYGFEEVEKAVKLGAVEKLVLADAVLRKADEQERLLLEEIMRTVERKGGGTTMIVSTEHESGAKLLALGGIAALLRYPIS
jgi:protein pelota